MIKNIIFDLGNVIIQNPTLNTFQVNMNFLIC